MGKLTHSVSGSVASFKSMDRSDLTHLKAYFTPVQEEGYPSPIYLKPITGWTGLTVYHSNENLNPVRNLYDISSVTFGKWISNTGYFFDAVYGCISKRIPVNSGDVINAQVFGNTVYSKSLVFYNSDGSFNTRYHNTGNTTLSYTSSIKGFVALQVAKGIGNYDIIDRQYLEDAQIVLTINSLPSEYIAYTGPTIPVTFPIVGKNKFPNPAGTQSDIDLVAGVTYTVSANVESTPYFKAVYEDGTESGYVWLNGTISGERHSNTFTPNKHVVRGRFFISDYELTECQIEEGNTFTSYEAYSNNNTVFGGYVDLVTGELVKTWESVLLNDPDKWLYISQDRTDRLYYDQQFDAYFYKTGRQFYSLMSSYWTTDSDSGNANYMRWRGATDKRVAMMTGTSLEDVKQDASDGKIQIAYMLNTPVTYHLSPIQLKALAGQNNLWSSANGNIEVEYEFTDYMNKRRISLNEPHIATATGSIASFNTDMHSKLEQYKLEFLPVQSGSGDPSSTNIRPITGWTGLECYHYGKNLLDSSKLVQGDFDRISPEGTSNVVYNDLIPVKPGSTLKFDSWATAGRYIHFYNINKELQSDYNRNVYAVSTTVTINVPNDSYYIKLMWYQQGGCSVADLIATNPQVVYDSLATYEAYNGTTIPVTFPAKKNLANLQYGNKVPSIYSGEMVQYNGWCTDYISVNQNTNYSLSHKSNMGNVYVFFYASDYTYIGYETDLTLLNNSSYFQNASYVKIRNNSAQNSNPEIQLEQGTSVTPYEPFGTVYGGYVDLVNGTLVKTHELINLTAAALGTGDDWQYWYTSGIQQLSIYNNGLYCNRCKPVYNVSGKEVDDVLTWYANGIIRWTDHGTYDMTKAEYNEYLKTHPITVTYKLTNPITYQLTPIQLKSLVGQNNIWSSANSNTTVKYWKHN